MIPVSMNTIDAKESFSDLMNRVSQQNERIILTRRGTPIAAIIPIDDFNRLQLLQNQEDVQEAIDALQEAREKGFVSIDDLDNHTG